MKLKWLRRYLRRRDQVLPSKLRLCRSSKLEWASRLLSVWQYLWRRCERCSSNNGDSSGTRANNIRTTADFFRGSQCAYHSARRLLRDHYNGRTRASKSSTRAVWNYSAGGRRNGIRGVQLGNCHDNGTSARRTWSYVSVRWIMEILVIL